MAEVSPASEAAPEAPPAPEAAPTEVVAAPAAAVVEEPPKAPAPAAEAAAAGPAGFSLDGIEMVVGTWAWGDNASNRLLVNWASASPNTVDDNRGVLRAFVNAGVRTFDTAPLYSNGRSEEILGQLAAEEPAAGVLVATKFAPLPWHVFGAQLRWSLQASLKRLKKPSVDLLQVHSLAYSVRRAEAWAEELAAVVKEGLARGVGVSNYSTDQMRRTHAVLQRHGVPLLSNQVEFSLLHRLPETSGLLDTCRQLGVRVLAYSPLAMGRLTGKFKSDADLAKISGRQFGAAPYAVLGPLVDRMREIGAAHGGKTPSQVALNWVICKGAIPIVGAKNAAQAEENAGAIGWRMTAEEVAALDALSQPGSANFWQGSSK